MIFFAQIELENRAESFEVLMVMEQCESKLLTYMLFSNCKHNSQNLRVSSRGCNIVTMHSDGAF